MRVYVIRHGESEMNKQKVWSGQLDTPLTDKGREDATLAREYLKGVSFDKVYASDLCRATETAKIALPEKEFETTALLREYNFGTLGGTPHASVTAEEMERVRREGYAKYNGESREDFAKRVRAFQKKLEAESYETVAAFCHGGFLRGMLDEVFGFHVPRKHTLCNNCAVAIFEYKKDVWMLHSWINLT